MGNVWLELKGLFGIELDPPHLPEDPECCAVLMHADIGLKGSPGADQFTFTVVTPAFLARHPETRWGNGYLLIPEFSWQDVERMVTRLVCSISGESWEAAARSLSRYMDWEFQNYQDRRP